MPLIQIAVTKEDVLNTHCYKNLNNPLLESIYIMPHFIKAFSNYVTVAKYKGIEHVKNIYHMDLNKFSITKEIFKNKHL